MKSRSVLSTVLAAIVLSPSAIAQLGQPTAIPTDPFSPFAITPGSSFAASRDDSTYDRNAIPDHKLSPVTRQLKELDAIIRDNYATATPLDRDAIYARSINQALLELDPHSKFHTRSRWNDLIEDQSSGYTGIGVTLAEVNDGLAASIFVLATFDDSPAAKAGLKFGDKVNSVNGVPTIGMPGERVRELIRGPHGTRVVIEVQRDGQDRPIRMELKRGRVAQLSVADSYLIRNDVGYIDLTNGFTETTAAEFASAAASLKRSGATSFVIDLRGNGGGIVDQAVKVAEYFLPNGTTILKQRGRNRAENIDWVSKNRSHDTSPLILLVDEETASASEILAGAFQDNDRALIVGRTTFGKGLVQSVLPLAHGTGITLTTARYLTPSGRSIQRDYSSVDHYDYYAHRDSGRTAAVGSYIETVTVGNRRVRGGNGIEPDIVLAQPSQSAPGRDITDKAFMIVRRSAATGVDAIRVSSNEIFADASVRRNIPLFDNENRTQSLSATDLLEREIRYLTIVSRSGIRAARRSLILSDESVKRAIAALAEARNLIATSRNP